MWISPYVRVMLTNNLLIPLLPLLRCGSSRSPPHLFRLAYASYLQLLRDDGWLCVGGCLRVGVIGRHLDALDAVSVHQLHLVHQAVLGREMLRAVRGTLHEVELGRQVQVERLLG